MPWVTVFLDLPAAWFGAAVAFWGKVTGYRPTPAGDGGPAALNPPSGDAYLGLRRLTSGPGGCGLGLHVDTGAEPLDAVADRARAAGALAGGAQAGRFTAHSPGGFPFSVTAWHGEQTVPPPLIGTGGGASRADTLCLDVPPGGFDRELAFWAALTGQRTRPAPVPGYAYLDGPAGWPARLLLQRREQAGPGDPVRGHVDFGCTDPLALERHVALGARVAATRQYWTVLSDPAGREYCLVGRDPA